MFINYNPQSGVTVNTYRSPSATNGDLSDLVKAVVSGDESVCCGAEGALDAICDGAYLDGLGLDDEALQTAVEEIHAALSEELNGRAGQADE